MKNSTTHSDSIQDWSGVKLPSLTTSGNSIDLSSMTDTDLVSQHIGGKVELREEKAKALLNKYDGLTGMHQKFMNNPGSIDKKDIEPIKKLMTGIEAGKRCAESTILTKPVMSSPNHVREYLAMHFMGREQEIFTVLFLNNRHAVVEVRDMFFGTIDGAAIYSREVVKACLSVNASSIIMAHNHPSGVAEPSDTDIRVTRKLIDALSLVDVRVLDHLIIGQGVQTSLAERQLM